MIRCRTCQKMFSKRKGTPLFGCRLAPEKALSMLEHLSDGCGVRQTSRLTKVSRDTVSRYDDRLYIWGRSDFLPNNETSLRL